MASLPRYNTFKSEASDDDEGTHKNNAWKIIGVGSFAIGMFMLFICTVLRTPEYAESHVAAWDRNSTNATTLEDKYIEIVQHHHAPINAIIEEESLKKHHTDKYRFFDNEPQLIVRRGFPFHLKVNVTGFQSKRPIDLIANPLLRMKVELISVDHDNIVILVETRPDADINQYDLILQSTYPIENITVNQEYPIIQPLVVLFNPWNKEDDVYMQDPENTRLAEYIENEYGSVFRGSLSEIQPMRWYYAQFSPSVLHTALYLMTYFKGDRSDPVAVSRFLTFAANRQDAFEPGVLEGKWDRAGNYSGGHSPEYWMGTDQIFNQYWANKRTVRWGQCWVFGAVLNTLLRAIGIPSRQLTNFNSAHEYPAWGYLYTHIIKYYYDETGRELYEDGHVWNFHSWNDAWMKRHDLGALSDGWQAVDATPQELSEGVFQMGPTPLAAVSGVMDDVRYDAPFVISEVRSEVRRYIGRCHGTWPKICTRDAYLGVDDNAKVAALMATSLPGAEGGLEDITAFYKSGAFPGVVDLPSPPLNDTSAHPLYPHRSTPEARPHAPAHDVVVINTTSSTTAPDEDRNIPDDNHPDNIAPPFAAYNLPEPLETPSFSSNPECSLTVAANCLVAGQPIRLRLYFTCKPNNDSIMELPDHVTVGFRLRGYYITYFGAEINPFFEKDDETTIGGRRWKQEQKYDLVGYWNHLPLHQQYRFDVFGTVWETKQMLVSSVSVDIPTPPINIIGPTTMTVNRKEEPQHIPIAVTFENPLNVPLTNCSLTVRAPPLGLDASVFISKIGSHRGSGSGSNDGEGAGADGDKATMIYKDVILPTETAKGPQSIIASMGCAELDDLHGHLETNVVVT